MVVNSWHFLVLALVAIILCRSTGSYMLRSVVLIGLNFYFIAQFLEQWSAVIVLCGLLLSIYVAGR